MLCHLRFSRAGTRRERELSTQLEHAVRSAALLGLSSRDPEKCIRIAYHRVTDGGKGACMNHMVIELEAHRGRRKRVHSRFLATADFTAHLEFGS